MTEPQRSFLDTENIEDGVFAYHDVADLEAMSLQEVEQLWDLVPTEDQDYLKRRYRKSIQTHTISSDKQELAMADQYLQRYVYEGLVPAGNQWARISATKRQMLRTGQTETSEMADDDATGWPLLNIAVVGFGIFLLIFVVARVMGGGADEGVAMTDAIITPTATPTYTPSPMPTITPTATATPLALVESDIFIESGDNRNRDWFPVQLQISRFEDVQPRVFVVQERAIDLTEWNFDPNPDVASWISGTTVRPIFGIPYSAANDDFLRSLASGSDFVIRMNTGSELTYRFAAAQELGRQNTALLRQDQPGIVVVLIGEREENGLPTANRYFVTGSYDPGAEVDLRSAEALPAAEGERIEFSDVSIVVDNSYVVPVSNGQAGEFMHAVVDVTLVGGASAVSLSGYQWFLDAADSRYSPDVSRVSSMMHEPMPSLIAAGQTTKASIAFLVRQFAGEALFVFSPPGEADEAFRVDFDPPPLEVTVEHLDIQLKRVQRSTKQVAVEVRIYNPQPEMVTLERDDMGMIFGFTPMPTGVTARPTNYEPLVLAPASVSDVTLLWDWNADDPYAQLHIAGRVWSVTLMNIVK